MKKLQISPKGQGVPRTSGAGVVAWCFCSYAFALLCAVIYIFVR
jgi:hypothetical protein